MNDASLPRGDRLDVPDDAPKPPDSWPARVIRLADGYFAGFSCRRGRRPFKVQNVKHAKLFAAGDDTKLKGVLVKLHRKGFVAEPAAVRILVGENQ